MGSQQTAQNFFSTLYKIIDGLTDYKSIQHDSLVHVSRFVQDRHSNQAFRQTWERDYGNALENRGAQPTEKPEEEDEK